MNKEIDKYKNDPILFVRDILGIEVNGVQKNIISNITDKGKFTGVDISSGSDFTVCSVIDSNNRCIFSKELDITTKKIIYVQAKDYFEAQKFIKNNLAYCKNVKFLHEPEQIQGVFENRDKYLIYQVGDYKLNKNWANIEQVIEVSGIDVVDSNGQYRAGVDLWTGGK